MTRAQSWQYLEYHAELCSQLAKILIEKQKGDKEKGRERWEELKTFLQKEEDQMQPVFDLLNISRPWSERYCQDKVASFFYNFDRKPYYSKPQNPQYTLSSVLYSSFTIKTLFRIITPRDVFASTLHQLFFPFGEKLQQVL